VQAITAAFAVQVQALEDALQAVAQIPSIDPVTDDPASASYYVGRASQLDVIGRIVGQPRVSADDVFFRRLLRARIAVNRSSGTPAQLLAVLQLLFPGAVTTLRAWPVASMVVAVLSPAIDPPTAALLVQLVGAAKQAGVAANVEWSPEASTSMFTLCDAATSGDGSLLGFGDTGNTLTGGAMSGAARAYPRSTT
jgi:hypothetical protein